MNIKKNLETINGLWKSYMATYLTPEEKILAKKFADSRVLFLSDFLKPSMAAMESNNYNELKRLTDLSTKSFEEPKADMSNLLQLQQDVAKAEFLGAETRYYSTRIISLLILATAIGFLVWYGMRLKRSITKPLNKAVAVFDEIKSGKFNGELDVKGTDELSQVLSALAVMKTRLGDGIQNQQTLAKQVLNQATMFQDQLDAISKSTGMLEMDADGNILNVNSLFLDSFGYDKQEIIGKNHDMFLDGKDVDRAQNAEIWTKLKRGESSVTHIKRMTKEGKEIWLDVTYNPIVMLDGDVTKLLKVVNYYRDVTAEKINNLDFTGQLSALGKVMGVIEFDLKGNILAVNDNFTAVTGYSREEIVGNHHSMFAEPAYKASPEYKAFWDKLGSGQPDSGQYKRIAKGGKEVWLEASYNPIIDSNGKPYKVVKFATDITAVKTKSADSEGQIKAISIATGVIEFDLTGKILMVNDNFAAVTGYSREEIVGNNHSMLVDAAYKASPEYKQHWARLNNGESITSQFRRVGKGGKEIWIQATYGPIFDTEGKLFKVVKFASDITKQHANNQALEAAVEEMQAVVEATKTGDLTCRVPLEGKIDVIANLCSGVNALVDKMTEVIAQVREAGETINTAAGEIASGNNDLSSRTEQQASSLEETASSMEELASTVKQNAENAKQANQLATAASGVAVKGGEVVGQVVATMSAINSSAKKIEDIISVIDGIAFQTNILALNAAVEAARAGEQGRGFAVVAGEVRNLAQRSASAAKEIKELISDSVSKTTEGTIQVEQAGKTMQEIVSSVQRVTDIMGEISAASSEQSVGIDQVNNAITSMDEVTQQNAALVEEAAAAAESLVEQASSLMDTVGAFRLTGGDKYAGQSKGSHSASTKASSERRGSSSPMRASAPAAKLVSKPAAKAIAKTGTDDSEWEEF